MDSHFFGFYFFLPSLTSSIRRLLITVLQTRTINSAKRHFCRRKFHPRQIQNYRRMVNMYKKKKQPVY